MCRGPVAYHKYTTTPCVVSYQSTPQMGEIHYTGIVCFSSHLLQRHNGIMYKYYNVVCIGDALCMYNTGCIYSL